MANFLTVYGGGSSQLAVQAEISPADARAALAAFRRSFPAIGRYSKRLQRAACSGAVPVKTPSKRLLHLDRDRLYAATNYVVQSAARDVLGEAILRVDDSPLGGSMLLPVHDEIIFQVPTGEANRSVAAMVELMSTDFGPSVHLAATGEVMGRSWGHGYNFAATPAERWFK
jgi:DNA polymerase-1